jgi:excisionase family DNA binding protein
MSQAVQNLDPSPTRRLWTIRETGESLHVSTRTVRRLIAAGKLRTARLGRCVRVVASSVDAMIAGETVS